MLGMICANFASTVSFGLLFAVPLDILSVFAADLIFLDVTFSFMSYLGLLKLKPENPTASLAYDQDILSDDLKKQTWFIFLF